MSLPEKMSRVVIAGTKANIDMATDVLYNAEAVHLIDHTVDADEGYTIGSPRGYSSKASERLLKVRSMEKELGINNRTQTVEMSVEEVKSQIESGMVESSEVKIVSELYKRNELEQKIEEIKSVKTSLELLQNLPVDLELYNDYKSLVSIVGTVSDDPTEALKGMDVEIFFTEMKKMPSVVAIFVRRESRDAVASVLTEFDFKEIVVPADVSGSPSDLLLETEKSLEEAGMKLDASKAEFELLKEKYAPFLIAADEDLSITVEKGEVPLRIANSSYSFIIDAWVPTKNVDEIAAKLEKESDGKMYVEFQETRGRTAKESEAVEERFRDPPSKMKNGQYTAGYEYATKLVDVPKYQEVDPTILIAIFLPLFFGFMVGDVGYAIPFMILGAYGLKNAKSDEFQIIARVLFFGGIWSFVFGMFFYGECLGMHFTGPFSPTSITWEHLFGMDEGALGVFSAVLPDFIHLHEGVMVSHVGVGKLVEIPLLLKLSVYIGIVHLFIGYSCKFYNVFRAHGIKHAFLESGGWLFAFVGMVLLCYAIAYALLSGAIGDAIMGEYLVPLLVGVVLLLIGLVLNVKSEGAMSIMELPGIGGNILSYTRLAAIGMSKAGMAMAFNYIAFSMIFDGIGGGILAVVIAFAVFAICHLLIFFLAILSAGLHALRLQYVELMSKFFEGGGKEYAPLKITRKKTFFKNPINNETKTEV